MKKEFILNTVFLISINLLVKPFYIFGIDRTVQNMVGAEVYGLYASLLSFSYLLQIVNDYGIQYFNNRDVAQDGRRMQDYFPNIVVLKCGLGLAYLLFTFGIGYSLGYEGFQFHLLFFLAANQILVSFIFYLRSNISGLQFYRVDSIFSALDKVLMILICSVLIWGPTSHFFRIEWFVYAQTAAYFLVAASALTWLLLRTPLKLSFKVDVVLLRSILRKSLPYALAVFLMGLYTRVDMVMLERLLENGKEETGIYAAGYRLLDACNMVGFLMTGLLLPMFARMLRENESIAGLLRLSFTLLFTISIVASAGSWFFQAEIMELLYHDATPYWAWVFGYLMLTFVAVASMFVTGTLLSANGSLRWLNYVAFLGALVNVGLNFYLIPIYGALGAAYATLATQGIVCIVQWFIVRKLFSLQYDWGLLGRLLFFAVAVYSLMYLGSGLAVSWFMALVGCGFLSLGLAIALGLVDVRELLASRKP